MEYTSNSFEYKTFIANQLVEQAKMERYIRECVLIGESKNTITNMAAINESVSDKMKEAFKKIMEAIGRMWGKFLESVTNLINSNRSYLEKYKDIILKKKLRSDVTYTMYNYDIGLRNMLTVAAPALNYESMSSALADQDQFIAAYFKQIPKSDATFVDRCKAYFRGSSETIQIPATKLNMTDIFNYCYNYDSKMKPALEKDLNEIKKASNNAAEIIDKAERERNSQPQPAPQPQNNNQNQEVQHNSYNMYGDKKYYSYVYEEYIEELEISYNNNSSNNGGDDNNPAKNMKNIQGNDNKQPQDQSKAIKADGSEYDEKIKKIQTYLNVCGGLLAAKQTIAEEMFKEYMQIIKAHVRDNVGAPKKDTSNDKVPDAGTNYKNVVDKAFNNPSKEEGKK